jgi:hypothetical protein
MTDNTAKRETTMLHSLIAAGVRLSDLLVAENRALVEFDLATAAMIAPEKRRAVEAFNAAEAAVRKAGGQATGADRDALADLSGRLADLATSNRRMLERALVAQDAVIRTLSTAATPKPALYTPPGGGQGHVAPPRPVGFAASA